jgi:hypothetical protein
MKIYVPADPPPESNEAGGAAPPAEESTPVPEQAAAAAEPVEYRQLSEGIQYVPAAEPPTLVEILPAQYQNTRPPLIYRLAKVSEPARPDGRIAESKTYHAKAFSCGFFYKPISRCLIEWEER